MEVGDGYEVFHAFRLLEKLFHGVGRRHSGRIPDRHVRHAKVVEMRGIIQDGFRIHVSLERAAERDRDDADQAEALFRKADHGLDVVPLLGARAVEVLLRVRLGGGDEQADLVHPVARVGIGQRALHRFRVCAGGFVFCRRFAFKNLQKIGCVRKLRNDLGIGVRGRLDPREAQRREALDQRALGLGGHERRLVLQAVARETLAKRHCRHG